MAGDGVCLALGKGAINYAIFTFPPWVIAISDQLVGSPRSEDLRGWPLLENSRVCMDIESDSGLSRCSTILLQSGA